jgi:hypothetical protein
LLPSAALDLHRNVADPDCHPGWHKDLRLPDGTGRSTNVRAGARKISMRMFHRWQLYPRPSAELLVGGTGSRSGDARVLRGDPADAAFPTEKVEEISEKFDKNGKRLWHSLPQNHVTTWGAYARVVVRDVEIALNGLHQSTVRHELSGETAVLRSDVLISAGYKVGTELLLRRPITGTQWNTGDRVKVLCNFAQPCIESVRRRWPSSPEMAVVALSSDPSQRAEVDHANLVVPLPSRTSPPPAYGQPRTVANEHLFRAGNLFQQYVATTCARLHVYRMSWLQTEDVRAIACARPFASRRAAAHANKPVATAPHCRLSESCGRRSSTR